MRLTAAGFTLLAYGTLCSHRLVHRWTGFAPDIPRTWDDEAIATLEDWFDPHRVRDDYVPTGDRTDDRRSHREDISMG